MSLKATTVSTHSLQLTRFGLVNCYLVREEDGFTLIDTGISGTADDLIRAAQSAGAPIRRIALTHAHVDHVGSVDALVEKIPGVELAASARSLPLLRQPPDKSLQPDEPSGSIKGGVPGIKTRVSRQLAEGERYGSLLVIDTPGHIPGHVALLDERDGTLYAGDALIAVGKLAVSGYAPWYFFLPNVATWNKSVALASARKLLYYPVERFACGHGAVRGEGQKALREIISSAIG